MTTSQDAIVALNDAQRVLERAIKKAEKALSTPDGDYQKALRVLVNSARRTVRNHLTTSIGTFTTDASGALWWKHPVSGARMKIPPGGKLMQHVTVKTSFLIVDSQNQPDRKIDQSGKVSKAPTSTVIANYVDVTPK